MAGKDRHFGAIKTLPTVKVKKSQIRKTRNDMKLRTFNKPLTLPSLELMYADLEKVGTLFSKKQLSKKVSEWFVTWRPWQQRILLCSMTEKCSKEQLHALVTSLEPVFHRDFVSQLRGSYPTKLLRPKYVHTIASLLGDTELRRYRGMKPRKLETEDNKIDFPPIEAKKTEEREHWMEEKEYHVDYEYSGYHEVESVEYDHISEEDGLSRDSCAVTPATAVEISPARRHEHAPPFSRKVSTRHFFPDNNVMKRLGSMKTVLRTEDKERLYATDPGSFKSSKWWEGHKGSKLLKPRRSHLSKHFKSQLNQINQWLEEWPSHERVDMLSEVVKCCDPDCLNFFALCLSRRLRDQTTINSLHDQLLHKVFSYLDIRSLCRSAQVCQRWRYLTQDHCLWRLRLNIFGSNEGVDNIAKRIEALGQDKHVHVDWKQAYQEVRSFYQHINMKRVSTDLDRKEKHEAISVEEEDKTLQLLTGRGTPQNKLEERGNSVSLSSHELVGVVVVKSLMNIGPVQSPTTTDQRCNLDEFETKAEDKNDLTGGNLKMLAKSLRALLSEKDTDEPEDVALDVRPSLVQAANLLESSEKENHTKFRYLSLAIQGVLGIQTVKRLQGHMDGVLCMQFDKKRVITGSSDRTLRIWDVRSGRSIRKIKGHKGGIRCLQFDNSKIVTGSWDMTIMVWHIVQFTRLRVLYGHKGCVSCIQFDEQHLVSGSHDHTIRIWNTTTWECTKVIQAHDGIVTCLEFDGKTILSGSNDKTLKLWDVQSTKLIRVFAGHVDAVNSVKVAENLVISGSGDGMIMFWDLETGACEAAIQAHEGPVYSVSVCGDHFFSGGGDNLIKEWDMATCTCLRTLQGHRGHVVCVQTNSQRILSCSLDGTVRIWNLEQRNPRTSGKSIPVNDNMIEATVIKKGES